MSAPLQKAAEMIASKPDIAKNLAKTSTNWKEMAESGKLQSAANGLKELLGVFQVSGPAMSILTGEIKAETTEARVGLMMKLMELVEEPGVQSALSAFTNFINDMLNGVTKLTDYADKVGIIDALMVKLSADLYTANYVLEKFIKLMELAELAAKKLGVK